MAVRWSILYGDRMVISLWLFEGGAPSIAMHPFWHLFTTLQPFRCQFGTNRKSLHINSIIKIKIPICTQFVLFY